jgi:hypothetical protein
LTKEPEAWVAMGYRSIYTTPRDAAGLLSQAA